MDFEWDEAKREQVMRQRGIDLLDAALIFEGPVVTRIDSRQEYGEIRLVSVGIVDGECFVVVHTERSGVPRLITAWKGGAVSKPDIRRASLEEIRQMKERGELFHDPNAPVGPPPGEELPDDFWDTAVVVDPPGPRSVHLKLEPEVFDFFYKEAEGKGHITRMQSVLRAYANAHRKRA